MSFSPINPEPFLRDFALQSYHTLNQTSGEIDDKLIQLSAVFELINALPEPLQEKVLTLQSQDSYKTSLKAIKRSLENASRDSLCIREVYNPALSIIKALANSYRKNSLEPIKE